MKREHTPAQAIMKECQDCTGTKYFTERCQSEICILSQWGPGRNLSPLKRIKAHCQHCAPDGRVEDCEINTCPIYPYRFGKDPFRSASMKAKLKTDPEWQKRLFKTPGKTAFKQPRNGDLPPTHTFPLGGQNEGKQAP